MILDLLITLVVVAVLAVLFIGLLSPVESLAWWAGANDAPALEIPSTESTGPAPNPVVVYLSGIGSISGEELLAEEGEFLDRLEPLLPGAVIVRDVFPYSAAGVGLTGARVFASFWQLLERMRLRGDALLSGLINIRNVFQVAVAADPRYGPIFASGVARVIAQHAVAAGYRPGGSQRLVLLGYSGGAQVAVSAAPFLKQILGTNVD